MSPIRLNFWPVFACTVSAVIVFVLAHFILDTPLPVSWDEAIYLNRLHYDRYLFFNEGLRKLIGSLHHTEPQYLAGYRLFVLPVTLPFGVHPVAVKAFAPAGMFLAIALTYLAGKSVGSVKAGAFAASYLAVCPILIHTGKMFYTEYVLYPAIALLFYLVIKMMQTPRGRPLHWVAFTAFVITGGITKLSFFFVLAPVILILLYFSWRDREARPRPFFLITSLGASGLFLLRWWLPIYDEALHFLFSVTANFERHSLGSGITWEKFWDWLRLLHWTVLGSGLGIVTAILGLVWILRWPKFEQRQKRIFLLLFVSILPTVALSFSGTNNNPRYLGPVIFPLALMLSMIADSETWLGTRWKSLALAGLMLWQLVMMVKPEPGNVRYHSGDPSKTLLIANYTNMLRRQDQWDWDALYSLVRERGIEKSVIGYLGMGDAYNTAQIQYPWAKRNQEAAVRSLWRYEQGPIDWERVMELAAGYDVIVTAPGYAGGDEEKFDRDNVHNTEFFNRLEADPAFGEPHWLTAGKFDAVKLAVFFNRSRKT